MTYTEYLKQFEGQECYIKRHPDDDGMTVYFYSTQPEKTQFVTIHKVHDDFVVFLNRRVFDNELTYHYYYTCSLGVLFIEIEEMITNEAETE